MISETGAVSHEVKVAVLVEQAEQNRANLVAVFVEPVPAHHTVTIAPVFPLESSTLSST